MKRNSTIKIGVIILLFILLAISYFNKRYEIVALHPFYREDSGELKVLTWNVHCHQGVDSLRQEAIAEIILREDADVIFMTEFHLDSCIVLDSSLRGKYYYSENSQSRYKCGDIFYSKRVMIDSGQSNFKKVWQAVHVGNDFPDSLKRIPIQAIKATIEVRKDSVMILGCHWPSSNGDGSLMVDDVDSLKSLMPFYRRYKKTQESRILQANITADLISLTKYPVILMGDLNDMSSSAPLEIMDACGLKDSWMEGGFGYGCTFRAGWMRLRLDHIMHSDGLRLTGIKVVDVEGLSDHNALVASFKIED